MRLSLSRKFIFFSNPKTGSESMELLLDPYSDGWRLAKHIRPHEAQKVFLKRKLDYASLFKFTFTRNPWARLVSLYEHYVQIEKTSPPPFPRWLETVKTHMNPRLKHVSTACSFETFACDRGALLVDAVIKLEEVDKELPPVLERIGLPPQTRLPHVNTTRHPHYQNYYDDRMRAYVQQLYVEDIERFGYTF